MPRMKETILCLATATVVDPGGCCSAANALATPRNRDKHTDVLSGFLMCGNCTVAVLRDTGFLTFYEGQQHP